MTPALDDNAPLDNVADDQVSSRNGGQFLCIKVSFHISGFGFSVSVVPKNESICFSGATVDGNARSISFVDLIAIQNLDSPDANSAFDKELSEANRTTWQVNVATDCNLLEKNLNKFIPKQKFHLILIEVKKKDQYQKQLMISKLKCYRQLAYLKEQH